MAAKSTTDMPHARMAKKHIQRLQNMTPSPENVMRAHEALLEQMQTVTIPSGPFWQQT